MSKAASILGFGGGIFGGVKEQAKATQQAPVAAAQPDAIPETPKRPEQVETRGALGALMRKVEDETDPNATAKRKGFARQALLG
jgi:hypothetical protein